ncbi:MAG: trigger factor [Candidatus Margulisiibacteriota bacterium]
MKILKQTKNGSRVSLEIEIEYAQFSTALEKVIKEAAIAMKIPGFRPGKAPEAVVKQNLNMEFIKEKALDQIVGGLYSSIIKEASLEPVDYPSWRLISLEEGAKCVFSVEVEVMPEVTLGKYTGLKAEKKSSVVEEKEIDDYIKSIQEEGAKISEVSRPVHSGDIAELNVAGSIAGKPEPRLSQERLPILVGDNRIAPGFDANIENLEAGASTQFTLELPKDYYILEFSGKEAVFNVSVLKVIERILPEFNDEFVKKISSFESVEAYRQDVRTRIEDFKKKKNEEELKDSLLEQVSALSKIDIPSAMLHREQDAMIGELEVNLKRQGLTVDSYVKSRRMDLEALKKELSPAASSRVKAKLVLKAIADNEKLEFTEEDFTSELKLLAQDSGASEGELMQREGVREYIKDYVLRRKALDFIVESGKIKEK